MVKELRLTVDPDKQRFEVGFRDGQGMILFVDPNDSTKFIQKVSGKAPNLEMVLEDGTVVDLPLDDKTLDGL